MRTVHQRLRQAKPLPHPSRKAADPALGNLSQPDLFEKLLHPCGALIGGKTEHATNMIEEFARGHPAIEAGVFWQIANDTSNIVRILGDFSVANPGMAAGRAG